MLTRSLLSSLHSPFSTLLKSNHLTFNNSFSIQSLNQTMMLYVLNPSVYVSQNQQGIPIAKIAPGKFAFHLVETRLQYTKGVARYHYFLKLQDIIRFIHKQYTQILPLNLNYEIENNRNKQMRNLDIRYKQSMEKQLMTFYDLEGSKVNKIKRVTLEENEMELMKGIMRAGLYEMAGMDLEYQMRYEEILDEIVEGVREKGMQEMREKGRVEVDNPSQDMDHLKFLTGLGQQINQFLSSLSHVPVNILKPLSKQRKSSSTNHNGISGKFRLQKDPNRPKKPADVTAVYINEQKKLRVEQFQELSKKQGNKILSKEWAKLAEGVKDRYIKIYQKEMQKYRQYLKKERKERELKEREREEREEREKEEGN